MPYKIEICTKQTIDELMRFLTQKWSSSQMLSRDKAFADYTFFNKDAKAYNIMFARDTESGEIAGFIAYIPASFFDAGINEDFVWLTNWLVTKEAEGGLGVSLFMKVRQVTKCVNIGTVGQNKTAEALYSKLNFKIGRLGHYFIVNDKKEQTIISNYKAAAASQNTLNGTKLVCLSPDSLSRVKPFGFPCKTADFIVNKYYLSPYYKYHVYGLVHDGEISGAVVFKITEHNQSRCVRIVEYFGDPAAIAHNGYGLKQLVYDFDAEYLDFYCYGINEDILRKAGFEKKKGQVIIPNYFEPFVNENIEIPFAYSFLGQREFTVFKGDGDRDHKRYDTISMF